MADSESTTQLARLLGQRPEQDLSAILDLISSGASIHGARAIHFAAETGDTSLLEALVSVGGDVNAPDEFGSRPLHVAASRKNVQAISFLLRAGALPQALNLHGETPIECLEHSIESTNDVSKCLPKNNLAPREIDVMPVYEAIMALMPEDQRSQLIDGWMSPRMRQMLLITAELEARSIMTECRVPFQQFQPTPLSECVYWISRMDYLPVAVLKHNPDGFYESFKDGWGLMFEAMRQILSSGRPPTVQSIRETLSWGGGSRAGLYGFDERKTRHFFEKGGKIEYALDALLKVTENVLETDIDGWEYDTFHRKIEALPENPLDRKFDVAWVKCVGGNLESRGPWRNTADDTTVMLVSGGDDNSNITGVSLKETRLGNKKRRIYG